MALRALSAAIALSHSTLSAAINAALSTLSTTVALSHPAPIALGGAAIAAPLTRFSPATALRVPGAAITLSPSALPASATPAIAQSPQSRRAPQRSRPPPAATAPAGAAQPHRLFTGSPLPSAPMSRSASVPAAAPAGPGGCSCCSARTGSGPSGTSGGLAPRPPALLGPSGAEPRARLSAGGGVCGCCGGSGGFSRVRVELAILTPNICNPTIPAYVSRPPTAKTFAG
ncbi:PREDICTED: translation initiation factor IF-2-like [Ficedula albicollis]|uniref:translation initiation factor IF-2-like n=1 Tax=Ficedula albicollis TaxID=59894 RepID=UPI0007AD89E3|nr:PREDICTED: translation initiation factor IF-2-like [Ficedula albicollis]